MARRLLALAGVLLGLCACAVTPGRVPTPVATRVAGVEHLGTVTFATGTSFAGTRFGGISGLAYDAARTRWYALSDDRSQHAPARFYTLTIDMADGRLEPGDVAITAVTTLHDAAGAPFPALSLDPEGIALAPGGATVWISSEGDASTGAAPFVREFGLRDGRQVAALPLAARYLPAAGTGVRPNQAFESLTITPDGRFLVTATENALLQDGPAAGPNAVSLSRVLCYDLARSAAAREVVYVVGRAPAPPGTSASNGLVELLALDGSGTFLALERGFRAGFGAEVRLYEARMQGALDVLGVEALAGGPVPFDVERAVTKRELGDVRRLGVVPDNLEAMALGPALPDGRRLLVLASDDNFNPAQVTQFLAFAIAFEAAPGPRGP